MRSDLLPPWTPRRQRHVGASRGSARAPTSPQEGRAIAVKRPCNKALSSDSGSGKLAEDRVARERGLAARLVARSRPLRAAACDSQTTAMTGSGAAIGVGGRVRMRQPCDAARLRCGNCFCILNTRALQLPAWPHGHLPRVRPPAAALPLPALACLRASSKRTAAADAPAWIQPHQPKLDWSSAHPAPPGRAAQASRGGGSPAATSGLACGAVAGHSLRVQQRHVLLPDPAGPASRPPSCQLSLPGLPGSDCATLTGGACGGSGSARRRRTPNMSQAWRGHFPATACSAAPTD